MHHGGWGLARRRGEPGSRYKGNGASEGSTSPPADRPPGEWQRNGTRLLRRPWDADARSSRKAQGSGRRRGPESSAGSGRAVREPAGGRGPASGGRSGGQWPEAGRARRGKGEPQGAALAVGQVPAHLPSPRCQDQQCRAAERFCPCTMLQHRLRLQSIPARLMTVGRAGVYADCGSAPVAVPQEEAAGPANARPGPPSSQLLWRPPKSRGRARAICAAGQASGQALAQCSRG